jgi:outer membrane receptor protein involved in Fe transport
MQIMKKLISVLIALLIGSVVVAQTTFSGSVKEANTEQPIPGANIKVVGKSIGTTTDFNGNFSLQVILTPPFSVEISLIGYSSTTVEITQNNQKVDVTLDEVETALDEIVVSASRTPERVLESPVTIERMDTRAIRNTTSPTFYDGLQNLKGVDINTNSFTFKSVNTRGFATFANTRFMQLVDGMDNSSPALNFNLGNLLGMSELDVNTVELLPGASSALYGANAFNGIMFMTSKNPFDHEGVSVYAKTGLTSQKAAGDNNFVDAGIRMAHKFSDKFAAKASFSYLKGTDWHATDFNQYIDNGAGNADTVVPTIGDQTAFDQANIYGDEVALAFDFRELAIGAGVPAQVADALGLTTETISRTGYKESDMTDYDAESAKVDIALHYRPFADDLEIIYNAKFGSGNTIYQGANRYNIVDFFMQQHKIEVRNDNFFVRVYMTDEDAGDSYDMRFTGINMNVATAPQWYGVYVPTYIGAMTGQIPNVPAGNSVLAHSLARQNADATATLQPGTAEFDALFDAITSDPDLTTGSKFVDNTRIYHSDANYNFSEMIDFADIQLGVSWRQYSLDSDGTIFTDPVDGTIDYMEYGAYTQIQKKFADDRLKFTGSIRYDKAENFDGNVSPRISLSYSLGEGKTRNLRASFQTGFRNPTTQDLYIGLDAGQAILVGSAPDNIGGDPDSEPYNASTDRYTSNPKSNSATAQSLGYPSTIQLNGSSAYRNSFTLASLFAFAASGNPALLEVADFDVVQPERVTAYEVGYRAGFGGFSLDASFYYNKYEDFIGNKTVVVPHYGMVDLSDITPLPPQLGGPIPTAILAIANSDYQPFQVYTNSKADVSSYGGSLGLTTKIFGNYNLGFNYTMSKFDFDQSSDPDYEAGFNTPEHQVKMVFGNTNLTDNLGFNINLRWNDEYLWESTFADAIIEAKTVVDLQINYTVPKWKSTFKIGGANIGGKEYFTAPGNGKLGSQFYASWTINP